ncbi:MAG: glycosyltransferase [Kocuria sp.]|nr:glycosyltransferase [Kocuria sp.]
MNSDSPATPDAASQDSQRVALVCLHTSPLARPGQGDAGGMNVYVKHMAKALTALGHSVDLITLWRHSEHVGESVPTNTWAWSSPAPRLHVLDVALPETIHAPKEHLPDHVQAMAHAVHVAYQEDHRPLPEVIHSHYWLSAAVGISLARLWGIPAVTTLHTTALAKNQRAGNGEVPEPQRRVDTERQLIHDSDALVVNTPAEAHDLARLYDASAQKVRVIPPGVDTTVFHPYRDRTTAPPRPFSIGFAGRLQALKGPQVLVQALAALRRNHPDLDARVWIAGVGSPEFTEELSAIIRDHGLTQAVDMLGAIAPHELAQRFRDSSVVAVPSSSETFGLVALEAQACGCPVVATDTDGLRYAVQDGVTGWLLPDRHPATWANAFARIAQHPDDLMRRADAAVQRAQDFSWDATARAHCQLYGSLDGGRHTVGV